MRATDRARDVWFSLTHVASCQTAGAIVSASSTSHLGTILQSPQPSINKVAVQSLNIFKIDLWIFFLDKIDVWMFRKKQKKLGKQYAGSTAASSGPLASLGPCPARLTLLSSCMGLVQSHTHTVTLVLSSQKKKVTLLFSPLSSSISPKKKRVSPPIQ